MVETGSDDSFSDSEESPEQRGGILTRRPSYKKILNDLGGGEITGMINLFLSHIRNRIKIRTNISIFNRIFTRSNKLSSRYFITLIKLTYKFISSFIQDDQITFKSGYNAIPCRKIKKGHQIKFFHSWLNFREN